MTATFTLEELQRLGYEKRGDQLVRVGSVHRAETIPAARTESGAVNKKGAVSSDGPRYRSKSEAAYAGRLHVEQRAGVIRDWRYECITLRLADRVRYTPDFRLVMRDGSIELHEVKGPHQWEDARVKLQVAATMYPEFRFVLVRMKAGSVESFTTIRPLQGTAL